MTITDIITQRLVNQHIDGTKLKDPQAIVSWLGAMQAQEYAMAKWAIGLRLDGLNNSDIERAFNEGKILRTHLMRPTWHFVTPEDIRWLLALTAPRVHAFNASMYRKMELDKKTFTRSIDTIAKALEGGRQLQRTTLKHALAQAGVIADGVRLVCILMYAELEGIICSGAREGRQFTYALLDERVPAAKEKSYEEALATLAKRYFTSRAPATLKDFAWWSGLTVREARKGVAMLPKEFFHEKAGEQEYVVRPVREVSGNMALPTFLLPAYDEYGISYKDRSAIFRPHTAKAGKTGTAITYNHMIVIEGVIAGTWKQEIKKKNIEVATATYTPLNKIKKQALKAAAERYISFMNH